MTGSRDEAEDALQEALARAWLRAERGEAIVALRAWVGVVALNLARSRFRRLRAERKATETLTSREVASHRWDQAAPSADLATATRGVVRDLPRRQREVVFLHYYLDLPVDRVAAVLGISDGTVKKALHRAREELARLLDSETEASDATH